MSHQTSLVSVIMPVHNAGSYLEDVEEGADFLSAA